MKSNVKSVVVLSAICVVIAAILAVTNLVTKPIIEKNKGAAETKALSIVMPNNKGFDEVPLTDNKYPAVQKLFKEKSGLGFCAVLSTKSQYSQDNMGIIVAIGMDGKISGVALTGYYETKDFGTAYPQTYVGADSALNGIDTFSGVTYSSTAFKNAISDAFALLITSGAISEGQKSVDQMVKELIPAILPGCLNGAGAAQVTEATVDGFDFAFTANNGCGSVLAVKTGDDSADVYVVNAFGDIKCYDLEGNEKTGDKTVSGDSLAKQNLEKNLVKVQRMFGDTATITALESVPAFGCITGGFQVELDGEKYYAFTAKTFGFQDLMEMTVAVGMDGKIAKYKTNSDLIQEEEYYTSHDLHDATAYIGKFIGLDEGSYSDDMTAVSGATITAGAVASTLRSAFAAYKALTK